MNTAIELRPLASILNGRRLSLGPVPEAANLLLAPDFALLLTRRAVDAVRHVQGQFQVDACFSSFIHFGLSF